MPNEIWAFVVGQWVFALVFLVGLHQQRKLRDEIRRAMADWKVQHEAHMLEAVRAEEDLISWLESVGVVGLAERLRRVHGYSRSGKH
jgi:hypothetical protein